MIMTLNELLRSKVRDFQAETEKNIGVVSEWQASLARLFNQLKEWLAAADPDRILQIQESFKEVKEPGLGHYSAPRMDIRALGQWIAVLPKARRTMRSATPPRALSPENATGRVDVTDDLLRYILYRFGTGESEIWTIEGPDGSALQELNAKTLEAALVSYFR